jgi:regulator of protease activity HflC (stomatin/prohibitin superfamily)
MPDFGAIITIAIVIAVVGSTLIASIIKILPEYERGVIFRLGRLLGVKGPGLIILIPGVDRLVRVDLRTVTMDVPPQEVITRDNVPVTVDAVIYFRVIDPENSVIAIQDFIFGTAQIARTTLRSVLGQADLDELLSKREQLNLRIQSIVDENTDPWGVKVTAVEVKDVQLPELMKRAMAKQAEAERERRAKVIHAKGEFEAAEQLKDAAVVMSQESMSLQLRFLQTLSDVASEKNSTLVFPVPIDLFEPFFKKFKG